MFGYSNEELENQILPAMLVVVMLIIPAFTCALYLHAKWQKGGLIRRCAVVCIGTSVFALVATWCLLTAVASLYAFGLGLYASWIIVLTVIALGALWCVARMRLERAVYAYLVQFE